MIDIKHSIKQFNQYVKTFDFKNRMISSKFHHTYRVVDVATIIAESEHLSEDDIALVQLCALLHDIARFKQAADFHTFLDNKSFDHGDMAYEILVKDDFIDNFTKHKEYQKIILTSVKYHNKKDIPHSLTERELLFLKMIRDADKIDIMREVYTDITDEHPVLKKEILDVIYQKKLVENKFCITDVDNVLRSISFIFDINFNKSFKFMKENHILKRKLELLEANINNEEMDQLKKFINKELEERIDKLC